MDNRLSIHFGKDKARPNSKLKIKKLQELNINYKKIQMKEKFFKVRYIDCILDETASGKSIV